MTCNKSPAVTDISARGRVAMRQQRPFRHFLSTPREIHPEALCGPLRGLPAVSDVRLPGDLSATLPAASMQPCGVSPDQTPQLCYRDFINQS